MTGGGGIGGGGIDGGLRPKFFAPAGAGSVEGFGNENSLFASLGYEYSMSGVGCGRGAAGSVGATAAEAGEKNWAAEKFAKQQALTYELQGEVHV